MNIMTDNNVNQILRKAITIFESIFPWQGNILYRLFEIIYHFR